MSAQPRDLACRPGRCMAARPERCPCWFTLQRDGHDADCEIRGWGSCDCRSGIVRRITNAFREDLNRIFGREA